MDEKDCLQLLDMLNIFYKNHVQHISILETMVILEEFIEYNEQNGW